jgi:hypothetical protein
MNGPSAVATLRKVPVRSAVRWLIVGLIAVATVINYIDRNALAVMWPEIAREVGATKDDYALLVTVFMLAVYGLIEAPHLSGAESTPFFLGLLLVGAWMAGSMLIESRLAARTGQTVHSPGNPMTTGQVAFLLLVLWDFLVLGLILTAATPFWLAPEYVMGSLRNVAAILQLLQRLAL